MENISAKIKKLRLQSGLTTEEAAKQLDIDLSVYKKYEEGVQKLRIKHLISICLFYNISADYILGLEKKMPTETKKEQSFDCS